MIMDKYQILRRYLDKLESDLADLSLRKTHNRTESAHLDRRYNETLVQLEKVRAELDALAVPS